VFATNSLTILPEVDVIVVMKDGRIQEVGPYDTLRMNGGEFARLLEEHTEEKARDAASTKLNGKARIPREQFPRKVLVASVTRTSLTHYKEIGSVGYATRMLATFRPSRHGKMVWRVANVSATSRACRTRGI